MSIHSRLKDSSRNAERTRSSQEATAARIRIRDVDAEQAAARQPSVDVGSIQHVQNVFRKRGLDANGQPKDNAYKRGLRRKAYQEQRRKSVVRRTAMPVIASMTFCYATLSNGVRRKLGFGPVYKVGKPFPCGSST